MDFFFKKGDNTECEHEMRENIETINDTVYMPTRCFGGNDYSFKKEYSMDKYRADIAVFLDGKLKGVIEICNKHKNEPEKVSYYKNNKILYIEIDAQSVIHAYEQDTHVKILDSNVSDFLNCTTCRKINKIILLKKYNESLKNRKWLPKHEFKRKTRQNFNRVSRLSDEEVSKELTNKQ